MAPSTDNWVTTGANDAWMRKYLPDLTTGVQTDPDYPCGLESGTPARVDGSTYPGLGTVASPTKVTITKDGAATTNGGALPPAANIQVVDSGTDVTITLKNFEVVGDLFVQGVETTLVDPVTLPAATLVVKNATGMPTAGTIYIGYAGVSPGIQSLTYNGVNTGTAGRHLLQNVIGGTGTYSASTPVAFKPKIDDVNSSNVWVTQPRGKDYVPTVTTLASQQDLNNLTGSAVASRATAQFTFTAKNRGAIPNNIELVCRRAAWFRTALSDDIGGPGQSTNNDLEFYARQDGTGGEAVSVEYVAGSALAVNVAGNAITVTVKDASTKAKEILSAVRASTTANGLVIVSVAPGNGTGNGVVTTIAKTFLSLVSVPRLCFTERPDQSSYNPGRRITLCLDTDAAKTATSTTDQMKTLLQANTDANNLVSVTNSAPGATCATFTAGNLTGGSGGDLPLVDASTLAASGELCVHDFWMKYTSKTGNTLNGCEFAYISNSSGGYPLPLTTDTDLVFGSATKVFTLPDPQLSGNRPPAGQRGLVLFDNVRGRIKNLRIRFPLAHPAIELSSVLDFKVKRFFVEGHGKGDGRKVGGNTQNWAFEEGTFWIHPGTEVGAEGAHIDGTQVTKSNQADTTSYRVWKEFWPTGRSTVEFANHTSADGVNKNVVWEDCLFMVCRPDGAKNSFDLHDCDGFGARRSYWSKIASYDDGASSTTKMFVTTAQTTNFVNPDPATDPANANYWDNGTNIPGPFNDTNPPPPAPGPSDFFWVVGGPDPISDLDAANLHAIGNTDPTLAQTPGPDGFLWPALTASYYTSRDKEPGMKALSSTTETKGTLGATTVPKGTLTPTTVPKGTLS